MTAALFSALICRLIRTSQKPVTPENLPGLVPLRVRNKDIIRQKRGRRKHTDPVADQESGKPGKMIHQFQVHGLSHPETAPGAAVFQRILRQPVPGTDQRAFGICTGGEEERFGNADSRKIRQLADRKGNLQWLHGDGLFFLENPVFNGKCTIPDDDGGIAQAHLPFSALQTDAAVRIADSVFDPFHRIHPDQAQICTQTLSSHFRCMYRICMFHKPGTHKSSFL